MISDGNDDGGSTEFDDSIRPKSILGSFNTDSISIVKRLYAKLYPDFESQILDGQVYISHTFRKYSVIHWHGKIYHQFEQNAKNCLVIVSPHFDFTSSIGSAQRFGERLAKVHTHPLILPNNSQPLFHLFARVKWPMMYSQYKKYLKFGTEIYMNTRMSITLF